MMDFLSQHLPSQGVRFVAVKKFEQSGMHHTSFSDFESMEVHIRRIAEDNFAVYHACASFERESYVGEDGKRKQRTQANAIYARAFWLDIECTPEKAAAGKGYESLTAGLAALRQFCEATGLSSPTIVNSGGGIHCYWPMHQDVPKAAWVLIAQKFKKLSQLARLGLISDPDRTADIASLLRPPGTWNRKYDPPRRVELLEMGSPIEFEEFCAIVDGGLSAAQSSNPGQPTNKQHKIDIGDTGQYVLPEEVSEGGRNPAILSYVGHLRKLGIPETSILGMTQDFNRARCNPPLSPDEVTDIVSRYSHQGNPDWLDPLPLNADLQDVPKFDLAMLPDAFRGFVQDNAERMGQPLDFFGVPLMIVAAAALGSGWAICPKAHDEGWKESAVLWGGIVAPPGSKKTACLNMALGPIHLIEEQLRLQHDQDMARYAQDKAAFDAQQKLLKSGKGLASITGLIPEPAKPQSARALVQDATYQKLAEVMSYSPNGVLAVADEMAGMIASWSTKGQEAARGFFLTAWNGNDPYVVDRVERGTQHIARAYLCMMGGFQPGILASYVQQTMAGGSGDDGLVQRFQMLTYPDFPKDLVEVDRAADQAAADRMRDSVLRLRRLTPSDVGGQIELNGGRRGYLHFADDAQPAYDKVRKTIEAAARSGRYSAPISSHLAKMPGTIAKLALIIHLIDGGSGPVSSKATATALRWFKYLLAHAQRIYRMSGTAHVNAAKHLLDKVQEGKLGQQFNSREVKRKGWSGLTTDDAVGGALDLLVQTNWLRVDMQETGGRPTEVYTVHPQALMEAA
jgi:hypothetical protein